MATVRNSTCCSMDLDGEKAVERTEKKEERRLQEDRQSHKSTLEISVEVSAISTRQMSHPFLGQRFTMMAVRFIQSTGVTDKVPVAGRVEGLVAPSWREQGKTILKNLYYWLKCIKRQGRRKQYWAEDKGQNREGLSEPHKYKKPLLHVPSR